MDRREFVTSSSATARSTASGLIDTLLEIPRPPGKNSSRDC